VSYLISLFILIVLLFLAYLLSFSKNLDYFNKRDAFECGFNSQNNPNSPFNLPFFYVTLIFLIFDLELALLIFYPLLSKTLELYYFTFIVLLLVLFLTFYE